MGYPKHNKLDSAKDKAKRNKAADKEAAKVAEENEPLGNESSDAPDDSNESAKK